jgi:uncharacterized membrane protein YkoI
MFSGAATTGGLTMSKRLKLTVVVGAAVAALAAGAAIAGATGGGGTPAEPTGAHDDGSGTPITGSALDRAKAVALQATGGGEVTATEVRDEEGYYEVEVRRNDGGQVDVHLSRNLDVLDAPADGGLDDD